MLFNVTQLNFSHLHTLLIVVVPEVFLGLRMCSQEDQVRRARGGADTCYVVATAGAATTIIKCQQLFSNFQTFHFSVPKFFDVFGFCWCFFGAVPFERRCLKGFPKCNLFRDFIIAQV